MNWGSWSGCYRCSGYPQPGARALLAWLLETYPSGRSQGIYNCRNVGGTGTMSIHACGRAVDFWLPYVNGNANPTGHAIVKQVGAHGYRLGVQAAIFDRRVWSATSPTSRLYTGVHPHFDHIHWELTPNAGSRLTLATLRSVLGGSVEEESNMLVGKGSKGVIVKDWQQVILFINPNALPQFGADSDYGNEVVGAVAALTSGNGSRIGVREASELQHLYLVKAGMAGGGTSLPSTAQISGTISGEVTLST